MITAQEVLFKRGPRKLFENLNFTIHAGQKVGIVGRNGVGKSTLFNMITGTLQPDAGDMLRPRDWRLSHMRQEVEASDRSAIDFVLDGHQELRRVQSAIAQLQARVDRGGENEDLGTDLAAQHARLDDLDGHSATAKAATILHGLGFESAEFENPQRSFSGGWRIRLNLAQTLMRPADLLLLDEPTNHLDLEATLWLEQHLQRFPGTVLVIAHDREFLDKATQYTLHLSQSAGRIYRGGYSQYERQRAESLELAEKTQAKRDAQTQHLNAFIERFRAKASKAKQVQSRVKALERLGENAPLLRDSPYRVKFADPQQLSNPLLTLRDLKLGYGNRTVLHNVAATVLPGARIGVLGVNGAGKSTLLKSLVGDLAPLSGELTFGQHAACGYFAQHQLEALDAERTALATLLAAHPDYTEQRARDVLGGWAFDGTMVERRIRSLSGGEKARLVLALIAESGPGLLVLDEPTNHLDLDMRQALAVALQSYQGALIIVSHDRSLLKATVDELWVLENRQLNRYAEDLDHYIEGKLQERADKVTAEEPAVDSQSRKARRQAAAKQREEFAELRKTVRDLERQIEQFSNELKAVEHKLADPEAYQTLPADELDQLLRNAAKLRDRVERREQKWLELAAELEAAQA